ncbi:hypothetical protein ABID22_001331 [Pontibacter aydingkolensis]|uniref:Uncharacterized protein n=1 Tax=Pontibacter aydingkolensis TaxID=1911536 RepID=A0ABS7CNR9_9BACT|nr:hypothetical protein [Pontibacter aydingkolensis]MBW7465497.1 hypothetical protein [Pontibacter aydingkolensis]
MRYGNSGRKGFGYLQSIKYPPKQKAGAPAFAEAPALKYGLKYKQAGESGDSNIPYITGWIPAPGVHLTRIWRFAFIL